MNFEKYMSLKRFGVQDVHGINEGTCYIYPKLDGTNASIWYNEETGIEAGSRNRHLDESSTGDNAGFCKWARQQLNVKLLLQDFPHLRLFGEWLVPHSLRTYREDAWKRFYVFDVYDHTEERFYSYEEYLPILQKYELDYIPLLCKIDSPTEEELLKIAQDNKFLVTEGIGEGIVIKRYDFVNKYGRVVFAKIVTDEFKGKKKEKTGKDVQQQATVEEKIIEDYCTSAFIIKEYSKLITNLNNQGLEWTGKNIPELLGRIFTELVREETINFVHKYKNPVVDFRKLNGLCVAKIKKELPQLF